MERARFTCGNGLNYMSYDGDSNIDYFSDIRLKKDIENAENILGKVLKIKVRR